jgi:hypothetical protein
MITPLQSEAQKVISEIENTRQALFSIVLTRWQSGMQLLWGTPEKTQEIFNAYGANAGKLFTESQATVAWLESLSPGCTTQTLALMRPYTMSENGTVTLTEL